MDIAARRDDPVVEEMARSIYTMFPRCVRCGELIARYEDADVRVLSHRVVHRTPCSVAEESSQPYDGNGLSTGIPGDG
ncbi:MAG TPA: hypothetical protein VGM82_15160 [Gemmatimonadaceae bacterium]|jgi:hypothetical protein